MPRDTVRTGTVDTYRSILFTTQSILRDVGVPISAVSALFFPLFAVSHVLRIHMPPCFMRLSYLFIQFPLSFVDSTSLSRDTCQKFSIFFSRRRSVYNNHMNLSFLLFSLGLNDVFYVKRYVNVSVENKKDAKDKIKNI